ncbi:MAG: LysR family transcriptional regulator [Gammaproteobacteria bacterium]|nr:LysR family transcriptional regulator [Gammaproteobacteria bacterium]
MNSNSKIDLDGLRVVNAIVQEGSFVRAAALLHRVPSTISYTINKLESGLGIKIFERDGHRVRLTESGAELHRYGSELLRMAYETESAIGRLSTGWEAELRIAVHDFFPEDKVMALVREFYEVAQNTRLKIFTEVLTGAWDALLSGRVDFVIGIGTDIPEVGGFSTAPAGEVEFVFVVARDHPLAAHPGPLPEDQVRQHRAVAIADTSRDLPKRSIALLPGQPVLTVSTPAMKIQAHLQGLGVGLVPRHSVRNYLADGRLVEKNLETGRSWRYPLIYAWKNKHKGRALDWLKARLTDPQRPVGWFDD